MTMTLLSEMPGSLGLLLAPIIDTADAAFVVSLDCQFLAWGSRAQQLFGFSALDVLGRYCYDVMPARDASGQCLCGVNCPMVTAARYGYSAPASEARICTKQNCSIWVRVSPVLLRAPHGAICAILVLASEISRYKLTEQLVCWIAGRLDGGHDSPTFAIDDAAPLLRICFPDLTQREAEVLWPKAAVLRRQKVCVVAAYAYTQELGVARAGRDALIAIGYWGRVAVCARSSPHRNSLSKSHAVPSAVIGAGLGTALQGWVSERDSRIFFATAFLTIGIMFLVAFTLFAALL